jgi:hypothetical protein
MVVVKRKPEVSPKLYVYENWKSVIKIKNRVICGDVCRDICEV